MRFIFQQSLPCGLYTSFISVAVLGFHQSKKSSTTDIVVFSHNKYTYIHIYMFMQDAYWCNNKRREKTSLKKYTSHFIAMVRKGLLKVFLWEGVGDRTELQYIDPHSYGHQCCVFVVLQCYSTGGPGAQLSAECWLFHQLVWSPNSIGGSGGARSAWCGFPYEISSQTTRLPVFTELYNSSMPTQSPTQSLEWHVWSSSSGNNSHAVQRSLSSDASVYECIMGFYLVPFHQPNPPMRFLLITDHWNVSLPSGASLWNGMFGRAEVQYITTCPHINFSAHLRM